MSARIESKAFPVGAETFPKRMSPFTGWAVQCGLCGALVAFGYGEDRHLEFHEALHGALQGIADVLRLIHGPIQPDIPLDRAGTTARPAGHGTGKNEV